MGIEISGEVRVEGDLTREESWRKVLEPDEAEDVLVETPEE